MTYIFKVKRIASRPNLCDYCGYPTSSREFVDGSIQIYCRNCWWKVMLPGEKYAYMIKKIEHHDKYIYDKLDTDVYVCFEARTYRICFDQYGPIFECLPDYEEIMPERDGHLGFLWEFYDKIAEETRWGYQAAAY